MKICTRVLTSALLVIFFSAPLSAEFLDQPDTYASSLTTNSGAPVYDWQLANMVKMWIADAGYANMFFMFNQCYAGGMMDDLAAKLNGTGDVALMGAARHNETSWGLSDGVNPAPGSSLGQKGFTQPEDYYAKELGEEIARTGDDAQTGKQMADNAASQDVGASAGRGNRTEHPQSTFVGNGANIKLGKKSDGTDVASRHAILFMGKPDGERHWNDLERARAAFMAQGYTDADMVVLAGDGNSGKSGGAKPAYVDGAGTRMGLFDAFKAIGPKMNNMEQFVFWASDHGNRDTTARALDRSIADPVKQPVPATVSDTTGKWRIDKMMIRDLNRKGTKAFASVILDTQIPDLTANYLQLYLNRKKLKLDSVTPVYALDENPDLDGYEFYYSVPGPSKKNPKRGLRKVNKLEIGWKSDAITMFEPYMLYTAQIGIHVNTQPDKKTKKKKPKKPNAGKKKNKNKPTLRNLTGNYMMEGVASDIQGLCTTVNVDTVIQNPNIQIFKQDKMLVVTLFNQYDW